MKITLSNFGCHKNRSFEFPEKGMVLLLGESGAGKSTVLNAIVHALYGIIRKPQTFGESSCSIKLEIGDLTITRTQSPNRLKVRQEGEKSVGNAQEKIHSFFGMNSDEFMMSSYIKQRSSASILMVPPREQLSFIEDLAFDNDTHVSVRETIKLKLSEVGTNLENITGTILGLEKYAASISEVDKPATKTSKASLLALKKDRQALEKRVKRAEDAEKKAQGLRNEQIRLETEIECARARMNELTETDTEATKRELDEAYNELCQAKSNEKHLSLLSQAESNLQIHREELKEKIIARNQFLLPREQFEKLRATQTDVLKREITNLLRGVHSEAKRLYPDFKVKTSKDLISFLRDEKNRMEIELSRLSRGQCPECNIPLQITPQGFSKGNEEVSPTLGTKEEEFEKIKEMAKITELLMQFMSQIPKTTDDRYQQHVDAERDISSLEEDLGKIPRIVQNLFDEAEKHKTLTTISSSEAEAKLLDLQFKLKKELDDRSERAKLTRELREQEDKLFHVKKALQIQPEDVTSLCQSINELAEKDSKLRKAYGQAEKYKLYRSQLTKLKKAEKELASAKKKQGWLEQRRTNLIDLRKASKEAEIKAMSTVIENINLHANKHLCNFFDLKVSLEGSRETLNGRKVVQLNTQIEGDIPLRSLSGGEMQRCELAFLLALNDMMGSNIILLDECLNNLDKEVEKRVLSHLKRLGEDKLIVVVAHGADLRVFDHVIDFPTAERTG